MLMLLSQNNCQLQRQKTVTTLTWRMQIGLEQEQSSDDEGSTGESSKSDVDDLMEDCGEDDADDMSEGDEWVKNS